jgi:hypothetical protein
MSEEELLEESYVSRLFKAISNNNSVNGDEAGKGDDGSNGDDSGNGEELSSVHFPDLVFTSFKAAELIIISARCSGTESDDRWSEVITLFNSDGSIQVACNVDAVNIPPRHECFVDIGNHSLINLSVRDKPQPAYIHYSG